MHGHQCGRHIPCQCLQDFLRNNRGINDGGDLPQDFMEAVYDRIVNNEIKMKVARCDYERALLPWLPTLSQPRLHNFRCLGHQRCCTPRISAKTLTQLADLTAVSQDNPTDILTAKEQQAKAVSWMDSILSLIPGRKQAYSNEPSDEAIRRTHDYLRCVSPFSTIKAHTSPLVRSACG